MKLGLFGLFVLVNILLIPLVYVEEGPQVEFFSPQGTIKTVRQVTARFSEQMVPFGDPRDVIDPFDIVCPEKGTSRWADDKNWTFNFERDLPAEDSLHPNKYSSSEQSGGKQLFHKGFLGSNGMKIESPTRHAILRV